MLVIGNGESRSGVKIDNLDTVKVGCNAIYRDCKTIDHLVCVDKRMMSEVCQAGYNNTAYCYTRHDWIHRYKSFNNIREVPNLPYTGTERKDEPFHWGSGPYAVLIGSHLSKEVHLLGFDLYGIDNKINNIYKGTDNYVSGDKKAINPSYWIHQIAKVFECFPNNKFIIHIDKDWKIPGEWTFENVMLDKIENL
jgi:hypothetical protein